MDIDTAPPKADAETLNPDARVVIVTNLSRNVVDAHLQTIFSFYGMITKIDLPVFAKSGQNRGKAAVEFLEPAFAHKAYTHMNGGQLDGAILKLELSDLPVRSRSPPPPLAARRPPRRRSFSRSRSRSRSPLRSRRGGRFGDRGGRAPVRGRDVYRPSLGRRRYSSRSFSRSRSRSPVRRTGLPPRRRSPSYSRGGYGRGRGRSRSRSTVRSSRSRSYSYSRSRSRTRSRSYSSYSRSRSPSRARSRSRGRSISKVRVRSRSRDDIRDSRSRSPA